MVHESNAREYVSGAREWCTREVHESGARERCTRVVDESSAQEYMSDARE